MKLSPWFSAVDQPPVRKEPYQMRFYLFSTGKPSKPYPVLWDGNEFTSEANARSAI